MTKNHLASGCKIMDLKESKVYQISGCLKLANGDLKEKRKNKRCCWLLVARFPITL